LKILSSSSCIYFLIGRLNFVVCSHYSHFLVFLKKTKEKNKMNAQLASFYFFILLICHLSIKTAMAEWVAIKPSELYYNYVAVTWASETCTLAIGYSVSGGVMMKSTDRGLTWTRVSSDVSFGGLYGLSSKVINGVKYFVAVDEGGSTYASIGNGGDNWIATDSAVPVSLLDVSVGSNGKAFICGTTSSVYLGDKSDNFTSWSSVSPTTPASATFNGIR
jgi:DNA-binding transcriptional regulator YdaS (Cro superfamily)